MSEKPKSQNQELTSSHSRREKFGGAVVSLALMGLPLSTGLEAQSDQDRVAVEAVDTTPAPVEIQVTTSEVPTGEVSEIISETSSAHMEQVQHVLEYERDFHTEEEERASGLDFARDFVADRMTLLADPNVHITSLRVIGTASAEHGNDAMAGLTTPHEANDALARERAQIGLSSLQTALAEAMPGNPERLAELPAIEVASEVVTPTQEKLDALIAVAEAHGVTVNEVVDDYNQHPKHLIAFTEGEVQAIKDVLNVRGFRIEFQYEIKGEPVVISSEPETATVTIGSIKPGEKPTSTSLDDVMDYAKESAQFIVKNENAKIEESVPVIKKEIVLVDPPKDRDVFVLQKRDGQFKRGKQAVSQTRKDKVLHPLIQPGRGNYHNSHAGQAQRGKPGARKHMGRRGRK